MNSPVGLRDPILTLMPINFSVPPLNVTEPVSFANYERFLHWRNQPRTAAFTRFSNSNPADLPGPFNYAPDYLPAGSPIWSESSSVWESISLGSDSVATESAFGELGEVAVANPEALPAVGLVAAGLLAYKYPEETRSAFENIFLTTTGLYGASEAIKYFEERPKRAGQAETPSPSTAPPFGPNHGNTYGKP